MTAAQDSKAQLDALHLEMSVVAADAKERVAHAEAGLVAMESLLRREISSRWRHYRRCRCELEESLATNYGDQEYRDGVADEILEHREDLKALFKIRKAGRAGRRGGGGA